MSDYFKLSLLTFDDNKLPSSQKKDSVDSLDIEDLSDDEDEPEVDPDRDNNGNDHDEGQNSDLDSDDNSPDASNDSGNSKEHSHAIFGTNHQVSDSGE